MVDVLFELSLLSETLQDRDANILTAEKAINRTIQLLNGFKAKPGTKLLEARIAKNEKKYKSIELRPNHRHIKIDFLIFIEKLVFHLETRLKATTYTKLSNVETHIQNSKDYDHLINVFSVLDKNKWPIRIEVNYGFNEIEYLCNKYSLDLQITVKGFREYIENCGRKVPVNLFPLLNILNLIPISTSDNERGYSQMNQICTDVRSCISILNISNLLFININGPPIHEWDPSTYVKVWLIKHQSAEQDTSRNKTNTDQNQDTNLNSVIFSIINK